jgi:acetylornithine/N-succinyldiaminopimelate aminotransferase
LLFDMLLFDVYPLQPIHIERANGAWVWDTQGRQYLDMYGGHAVISIGHTHPHYVQRLTQQLGQLGFYSNSVHLPLQRELAETLGRVSGKPDYALFLCNSGAEANENALKVASFRTGRSKVVAFKGAFHGRTSLAVEVTDNPKIQAPVNQNGHAVFLPFNDIAALEQYFAAEGEQVAAVIVEGIQGVGGIRVADTAFLQAIRRVCDQFGAVFVADSVQCGYGRTGAFFAHDHAGVQADLYTVAKGMGNGFPVAGVLISPEFEAHHGMLGTTFGGNPLACAAALAVLEVMERDHLMHNATEIGAYLAHEIAALPIVAAVRGRGLMIGFEPTPDWSHLRQSLLHDDAVFTGEAKPHTVRLLPTLNLTREEADCFLEKLQKKCQNQHA